MTNEEYLAQLDPKMKPDVRERCLANLAGYGDNHWWLSDDPKVVGYYQLREPLLLVPIRSLMEGLEKLLGRPVWTHELGTSGHDALLRESQRAWEGRPFNAEEKAEAVVGSLERFQHEVNGKVLVLATERDGSAVQDSEEPE